MSSDENITELVFSKLLQKRNQLLIHITLLKSNYVTLLITQQQK